MGLKLNFYDLPIKNQNTKTLGIKPNGRSSDFVTPNFIMGCNSSCKFCVAEGTLITTINGQIPVEKIRENDFLLSYNSSKEHVELDVCLDTSSRLSDDYYKIELEGGQILLVTGEHPIYIKGKGWVEAQYLNDGDEVIYGNMGVKL